MIFYGLIGNKSTPATQSLQPFDCLIHFLQRENFKQILSGDKGWLRVSDNALSITEAILLLRKIWISSNSISLSVDNDHKVK